MPILILIFSLLPNFALAAPTEVPPSCSSLFEPNTELSGVVDPSRWLVVEKQTTGAVVFYECPKEVETTEVDCKPVLTVASLEAFGELHTFLEWVLLEQFSGHPVTRTSLIGTGVASCLGGGALGALVEKVCKQLSGQQESRTRAAKFFDRRGFLIGSVLGGFAMFGYSESVPTQDFVTNHMNDYVTTRTPAYKLLKVIHDNLKKYPLRMTTLPESAWDFLYYLNDQEVQPWKALDPQLRTEPKRFKYSEPPPRYI